MRCVGEDTKIKGTKVNMVLDTKLGRKSVSEILSMLIVVLMGVALVGTVYSWGMPIISKKQDMSEVDRLYNYFDRGNSNSLVRKIEFIAKNGGDDTFVSEIDGLWNLSTYGAAGEANFLEFITLSKVSNIAISNPATGIGWVALTPGGSCPPTNGIVGFDPSYVVCARAEKFSDGFRIKYRIWFRELYESSGLKGYRINLVKPVGSPSSSNLRSLKISRESVTSQIQGSKTLIITEIEILLS